jgi:hypothetical protein
MRNGSADSHVPERAGLVLATLILVAAVANLNRSAVLSRGSPVVSD